MRFAGTVILYNTDKGVYENILTYADELEKMYGMPIAYFMRG